METASDNSALEARSDNSSEHPAAQTLAAMRSRARRILHAQQERIRHFESNLNGQLESIIGHYQTQQESALQRERELIELADNLQQQLTQNQESRTALEETLDEARIALSRVSSEQRALHRQVAEGSSLLEARDAEVRELRDRLAESSGAEGITLEEHSVAIAELQSERDELLARLEEMSARASSEETDSASRQEMRELQQRFEMAVQEVRELKSLNDELSNQANGSCSEVVGPPAHPAQGFDWEDQKRRLLAELESDFDASDPGQLQGKMTVEGAIRITDQVVAEKEREIEELKALLQDQTSNLGDVAVGAAAIADMLDQDELIRGERENLSQLQAEWREKLRKAEVDISVERAKIARERNALEEKVRSLEAERAQFSGTAEGADKADKNQKAPRGRWLTRLGLQDNDD